MLYTPQTKLAMEIAYRAHHGQRDKGGMPYVFHPYHLAEQMETELEVTAALLHEGRGVHGLYPPAAAGSHRQKDQAGAFEPQQRYESAEAGGSRKGSIFSGEIPAGVGITSAIPVKKTKRCL